MEERELFIDLSIKSAQHVNLRISLDLILLPMSFIYIAVVKCNQFSGCQQASQFTYKDSAVLPSGAVRDNRFMNEAQKNDPKQHQSCRQIQPK